MRNMSTTLQKAMEEGLERMKQEPDGSAILRFNKAMRDDARQGLNPNMTIPEGPCNCCAEETENLSERRDDDGWFYCAKCWRIGAEEEAKG